MSVDNVNRENKANIDSASAGPWDALIEKARQELREAKKRVSELTKSIAFFEKKRDAGDSWPGV